MNNFKVVIFCSDETLFLKKQKYLNQLGISSERVFFGNSGRFTRIALINQNRGQWLLFLDHDCELTPLALKAIASLPEESRHPMVFAGRYLNPEGAAWLQKGHNFIANGWLEQSYLREQSPKLILGGIFLVFCNIKIPNFENEMIWGAEDKILSYEMHRLNFEFRLLPDFAVVHSTSPKLLHFLKRAWLHGINDSKYITENKNAANYPYWIRRIGFANLHLVFLILLHFCIQKMALLIQTARR